MIFDDAFIPWENVLVYRDVEKANALLPRVRLLATATTLQSGTRLASSSTSCAGCSREALEANGTDDFRGVQAALGELVGWRNLIWALTTALCHDPQPGPGGTRRSRSSSTPTLSVSSARWPWPAVQRAIFDEILGGAPLVDPVERRGPASPTSCAR